jgi:hypothetical protein
METKRRPLIMSFQKFYGPGAERAPCTLAAAPGRSHCIFDTDRARATVESVS